MPDAPFRLRWFCTLVPVRAAGPILEVGCGNGQLLALLARRCARARIVGIDRSPLQARRAIAALESLPPASRPTVHPLALEEAAKALGGATFPLIVAMNVNLLWTAPAIAGAAFRTLLAPRGRLLLGFEPPTPGGRSALRERVVRALPDASLRLVQEHHPADRSSGAFALVLSSGARHGDSSPRIRA